jgi:hypothetical protein
MTATFIMPITLSYADLARARVAILRPEGAQDRSSFDELIAQAWAARDAGAHHLIVDMSDVERVSTAGLVGLHGRGPDRAGAAPPDPGAGWAAIRALAEDCCPMRPLAVVNPRPLVRQALAHALLSDFLAIHADLDLALAALAA